jgi:tripartite ATP-independent transporter DctP family solute receptor
MKFLAHAIALGLLAATLPASAQTITLKAGHSAAATEPYHLGLADFAERVAKATNGKVAVQIFPQNQLGNERDMIEGLQIGSVDITVPANAVFTNFVPDLIALDMPFLFRDQAHLEKSLGEPLTKAINEAASKRGFRVLGLYTAGTRHIMTTGKPVNSAADLKGMKIRTMQNPAHVAAFTAMGANPTPLAYGELYGALQAGVVDGAEAANTNYAAQKFYEVAPNWAMVSWTVLLSPLIMSERKFQSLPKDVQAALMEAGKQSAIVERAAYAKSDEEKLAALQKSGAKITRPDPEPFRASVKKVYADFIKTDAQKNMVKIIQSN